MNRVSLDKVASVAKNQLASLMHRRIASDIEGGEDKPTEEAL